jgi:hypothetical protein
MNKTSSPVELGKRSKKIAKASLAKPKLKPTNNLSAKEKSTAARVKENFDSPGTRQTRSKFVVEETSRITRQSEIRRNTNTVSSIQTTLSQQLPKSSNPMMNMELEEITAMPSRQNNNIGSDYHIDPELSEVSRTQYRMSNPHQNMANYQPTRITNDRDNSEVGMNNRINNNAPPRNSSVLRIDFPTMTMNAMAPREQTMMPEMPSMPNNNGGQPRCSNISHRNNAPPPLPQFMQNMFATPPPNTTQTTYNSYSSNRVEFTTNRSFPPGFLGNTSTFSGTSSSIPNVNPPRVNNPAPEFPSNAGTQQRQQIPPMQTGRSVHDINYVVISGHSVIDMERDMNEMFGPNGIVPRQIQHFRQAISGLTRLVNSLHRPNNEMRILDDLEEFPVLRREGLFDDSFFDILMSHGQPRPQQGQRGLAPEELATLPTAIFQEPQTNKKKSKDANEDKKGCVICLCDFQGGEEIRSLTCAHAFHKSCIDSWLSQKGCCPICRRNLTQ